MTNQEAFNTALQALRVQGVISAEFTGSGKRCLYRGPNGTKCAVGHLLPDEEYQTCFDYRLTAGSGMSAKGVQERTQALKGVSPELLNAMQRAHDQWMPKIKGEPMNEWEGEMACIADDFGLIYTAPGVTA